MIDQSQTISKLASAIVAAHAEMDNPTKDRANAHHKYKYATLEALLEVAKPVMARHKLTVVQMPGGTGDVPTLVTILIHESGEYLRSEMPLTLLKPESVRGPQALGSAITYARRYALQAVLGVTAEDDDDAQHASQKPKPAAIAALPPGRKLCKRTDKIMDSILAAHNKSWAWVVKYVNQKKGTNYTDANLIPAEILDPLFDYLEAHPLEQR